MWSEREHREKGSDGGYSEKLKIQRSDDRESGEKGPTNGWIMFNSPSLY